HALSLVAFEPNADVPSGRDDRPVPAEAPGDFYDAVLDDENARARAGAAQAERRIAGADLGHGASDVDDLRARARPPACRALEIGPARRADIGERGCGCATGVECPRARRLCRR